VTARTKATSSVVYPERVRHPAASPVSASSSIKTQLLKVTPISDRNHSSSLFDGLQFVVSGLADDIK